MGAISGSTEQIGVSKSAEALLKEVQNLKEIDTNCSEHLAREAAVKGRENGKWQIVSEALLVMAYCCYRRGQLADMADVANEAFSLFEAQNDAFGAARARHFLGIASIYLSNYPDAIAHLQASLATFEALGKTH